MENRGNNSRTSTRKNSASTKRNYEENKRKMKKKKKSKKVLIIIVIFFIIGILVSGCYLLFTSSTFNVKEIEIVGTQRYTKEQLMSKLNISFDKNIFIQLFTYSKDELSEFSFLSDINLDIKLPNKIILNLTERVSEYLAFDKDKNKFFKIDKDGYILEEGKIEEKSENEMLVYGITFADEITFGEKINEIDYSKILTYLNVKNEYEKNGINMKITKVSFEDSLTTLTLDDKLIVKFPNEIELEYKMNFLKGIIEKLPSESVGIIDMTKSKPIFSSF